MTAPARSAPALRRRQHRGRPSRQRALTTFNALGLGLILLAFGSAGAILWQKYIVEPRQAVAQVRLADGRLQTITSAEFQERLRFEHARYETPAGQGAQDILGFGASVIERMTREILVREEAARRGLRVNEAEIDGFIAQTYGAASLSPAAPAPLSASASPPIAQADLPAPASFEARYQADLKQWARDGLTEPEFRTLVRAELLEKKLQQAFTQAIPTRQDQVRMRLIRFASEADARKALSPGWDAGAFARLYDQVIDGQVSGASGELRDWSSAEALAREYGPAVRDAAFSVDAGGLFDRPVSTPNGWYLGLIMSHEVRDLPDDWREQLGAEAFQRWLDAQQARVSQFPLWMARVPHDLTRP